MIETRLLYYFLAVSREQNITRAAKALNITQSTLSKQMMNLEEQLGCTLFERGKRKIILTEEGHFLRKRAVEILELVNKTETAFKSEDEILSGDITIACGETAVMDTILDKFKLFHQKYPDVKLHLYSGNADSVLERLDKGLADFGLLFGPNRLEKYEYRELNEYDRFGLLMSKNNPLAKCEFIKIEQLYEQPLIISEQLFSENNEITLSGGDYSKLNIVATYNLIYNATYLAEKEIGSILCLDRLVNTSGRNLVFRPIEPELKANLSIVRKKYQNFSPAAKAFLKLLENI